MHFSHHPSARSRRQPSAFQKGYVLVMFALLLIPMLLVAGLSVDVGLWYNRASDMRKAADSAALAGVVWLPDEAAARTAAFAAAERNGFTHGDNVTITVEPSTVSSRRLRVTISDDSVGSFFWGNLGGNDIDLTRTSFAEYVLPVPMGSPRNFLGTGLLLEDAGTGYQNEELFLSVNPYCTDKVNGDRHQSGYHGTCDGARNDEYRPTGYETYIEVPANPVGSIDVLLYDARYNEGAVPNNQVVDTVCTYPGWTGYEPYRRAGSGGVTLWGPLRYQTWSGSNWRPNGGTVIDAGDNAYISSWTYYRVSYPTGPQTCTDVYGSEPAIDSYRQSGQEPYTFSLYAADNTPLNDTDNPLICTQTFQHDTPFNYGPYLGSVRWNRLCTITNPEEGRYILRVRNGGAITNPEGDGSNQYGVVARYASAANPGLCDGRNDNRCPRVFGKEALSVRAASSAEVAQFFLAEIAPEHDGKTLRLELFDPGEGGNFLRILRPNGADSWTPVSFTWSAPGVGGGTTSNLPVRDGGVDRFNGRTLTIDVQLNNYNPPANNQWWKIEYEFRPNFNVTDRTTWSAAVLGDPIHLVEEF